MPAELEAILRVCLAKEPGARYASAAELRDDLGSAGAALKAAIERTLADSANHTRDLGGTSSTSAFGDALLSEL